jgi:DNA-binding winged helix-turn-helix (wHTH) protein
MERDGFTLPYIVNVIDCATDEVIYGYQIGQEKQDIVPCLGRKQPRGCYILQVALLESEQASSGWIPSLGILATGTFLVIGLLFFNRQTTNKKSANEGEPQHFVNIGSYAFQSDKGLLRHEGKAVELTTKETRVLAILSREINATVLREKLNEIWADEGVITGRSLDVFVSKLRKRFVNDPTIRIINVHGKGYRLEVGSGPVQQKSTADPQS